MNKKFRGYLLVLIVLTLFFIFSNSMDSAATSSSKSQFVLMILEAIFGKGRISHHFVRKLAHFCEFGLLGLEMTVYFRLSADNKNYACLFWGLICALSDETVQLFSDRGSQVQDVWLDFSGYCCGFVVVTLAFLFLKRLSNSK